MRSFFVEPAHRGNFQLPTELSLPTNWQRPLFVAITATLVALLHGACMVWYLDRPASEAYTQALALPMIDIALQAPNAGAPTQAIAPPTPPKSIVKPIEKKTKPKPKLKPIKKPQAKAEIKKPIAKPDNHAAEAQPQSAAPAKQLSDAMPVAGSHANSASQRSQASDTPAHANADYLNNPKPKYPGYARQRHWEGLVVLRVLVTVDGRCGELVLQRSSGHETLDEAAMEAVRAWRFVPGKHGDTAVSSWVNVPIQFELE
ncbi:MAG: energy transducer TonB [Methylovulum sp.]|nr:energy transducer TonB [Methylovulum sp.]